MTIRKMTHLTLVPGRPGGRRRTRGVRRCPADPYRPPVAGGLAHGRVRMRIAIQPASRRSTPSGSAGRAVGAAARADRAAGAAGRSPRGRGPARAVRRVSSGEFGLVDHVSSCAGGVPGRRRRPPRVKRKRASCSPGLGPARSTTSRAGICSGASMRGGGRRGSGQLPAPRASAVYTAGSGRPRPTGRPRIQPRRPSTSTAAPRSPGTGPGQLIAYPIVKLREPVDVVAYVGRSKRP